MTQLFQFPPSGSALSPAGFTCSAGSIAGGSTRPGAEAEDGTGPIGAVSVGAGASGASSEASCIGGGGRGGGTGTGGGGAGSGGVACFGDLSWQKARR